jgi:hypothetical protein
MRKFFLSVTVSFLFIFVIISCNKSNSNQVPKKGHVEIITANSWKLKRAHGNYGNSVVYYERGDTTGANTFNFDFEYITFKKDSTGIYTDNSGVNTDFIWSFDSPDSSNLTWIAQFNPITTIHWSLSAITSDSLKFLEQYNIGSTNVYQNELRIPK